jgi:hypothetical protein
MPIAQTAQATWARLASQGDAPRGEHAPRVGSKKKQPVGSTEPTGCFLSRNLEREKGFEPSTSTLASEPRRRKRQKTRAIRHRSVSTVTPHDGPPGLSGQKQWQNAGA